MRSNYESICQENRQRYGTEGAQKSGELAASLYDNQTHFIFELLQNAEDAIKRRGDSSKLRKVSFKLTPDQLSISHFGKPFNTADVKSVCDIAETTKDESAIGRFGLGFKSVYTVTDLPEIHSGEEGFAIQDYVFPIPAKQTARDAGETLIVLPLKSKGEATELEITEGFRQIGPESLLFLQQINEINWSVEDGASGFYIRNSPEKLGPNVERISVIGQETGQTEIDQNWLVFHRDVFSYSQNGVGRVEIAFSLIEEKESEDSWTLLPRTSSPLVVFFPTVVESHLGFLIQGPYLTTPSRDNIPSGDSWNQHLINETADLLVESMRWMRDKDMLNTAAMRCLPINREKFPQSSMFAPIFDAVQQAFQQEALLPTFNNDYIAADQAMLARTKELRDLFDSEQITKLFEKEAANWLSGDITQDRGPEIRQYVMRELGVPEITPSTLLPRLTQSFLEAQSDEWVSRLYEFLSGQESALRRRLDTIPLFRLDDGTHVVSHQDGKASVFLPSDIDTNFPTLRRSVCNSTEARSFLISLGITEPDPVDDVIWNVLPKYQKDEIDLDKETYAADIKRISLAFSTDSTAQRDKLRTELKQSSFVMVIDTGDGKDYISKPDGVYIATDRLKQLFAGVPGVFMVDNKYECLRGEEIRDLLVACGASRYLSPFSIESRLSDTEKDEIRRKAGLERCSREHSLEDYSLRGLAQLLELLPELSAEDALKRSQLLWNALSDLEARGTGAFYGSYKWGYFHESKTESFDADFIRTLNQFPWIPSSNGELLAPDFVVFETLGFKPNPFLLSKIVFKSPVIDQLAIEAGIDPAALDLLRQCGITNATELASRLGITNPTSDNNTSIVEDGDSEDESSSDSADTREGGGRGGSSGGSSHNGESGNRKNRSGKSAGGNGGGKRPPGQAAGRPFISYVGTHPEDDESDPDNLDQAKRMQIEQEAIELITSIEPALQTTAEGNPGFDLYEINSDGEIVRWVEVKSMTGCLEDRPVGLSRKQFEYARKHGSAYWLYVVEFATVPDKSRVVKIRDPYGLAKTFTFDHGWSQIAESEAPEGRSD